MKYISELNMRKAEYLLEDTNMGVADIARLTALRARRISQSDLKSGSEKRLRNSENRGNEKGM